MFAYQGLEILNEKIIKRHTHTASMTRDAHVELSYQRDGETPSHFRQDQLSSATVYQPPTMHRVGGDCIYREFRCEGVELPCGLSKREIKGEMKGLVTNISRGDLFVSVV